MAPSATSPAPLPSFSKHSSTHPLAPLSADEIAFAASLIKSQWPAGTALNIKAIMLEEPPKAQVLPLLEAEHSGQTFTSLPRKAYVSYYLRNSNKFHEAILNLSDQTVEQNILLGANIHGGVDGPEIVAVEKLILEDDGVQKEIAKLRLPEGSVVIVEPWIFGSDGVDDDERLYQAFLYVRDPANPSEVDSNHYAHPLPLSPVVSTETMKVIRIEYLPTGAGYEVAEPKPYKAFPANEYIPEAQKLRLGLKPLSVIQPEGTSFTVVDQGTSSVVSWQKWTMRVGFNQREGPVIHNVRYDGRDIFYRLSLSDMNIPYADPRAPFHRKSAFDLGDAGAGLMANNLKLGCDCLGSIHYLSSVISNVEGEPLPMPNVICVHEQDAGIGWKHTNYRTGRAAVVRNRELVLQTIITVANYEYILAYVFNQAGEFHYEVRATGILSTQPIDDDVEESDWGTIVHPGVLAVHHQHIFSLRIDPAIDGHANRLVYAETHAMPLDTTTNPHGNGYVVRETLVKTSGGFDIDYDANRTFKIQNTSKRNPVNNKPVAYKIHAPPFQKILSHPSSFNHRRAEFADRNIYATAYRDDELYAGGKYTNQSRGATGVRSWASRNDDIVDKDLVVFVQFGLNHVPRVEDFPVMPCEVVRVSLKPVNFFDKNPALDVPPSEQSFNRSVLVSETHRQPALEAEVERGGLGRVHEANGNGNGNGACCS